VSGNTTSVSDDCGALVDLAPSRTPCSHIDARRCHLHRVGYTPCAHLRSVCQRSKQSVCVPPLVRRFPPADPPFNETPSAHNYLWINMTSGAAAGSACGLSASFASLEATIRHASRRTLMAWYDARMSRPALLRNLATNAQHKPKLKMQFSVAAGERVPALAARLLSKPPILLGRLGNVEALNAVRIADGLRALPSLQTYAGVYPAGDGGNASRSMQVERVFQRSYVRALRESDRLLQLVEQSSEHVPFLCRFEIPLSTLVASYDVDALLALLVELAKRRARILLVTGFAASIHRQLPRLATVHPDLELAPLRVRLLRTPLDAFREPRHREYPDWAAALAALEASDEWDATRSDVALLGCGAFGMPLAAHARSRGLAALYVGGRLPALFGVVGRYDRKLPQVRARINQHWIAPLPEETPEAARASSHESHGYWDDV
jgi:hypothetical protein